MGRKQTIICAVCIVAIAVAVYLWKSSAGPLIGVGQHIEVQVVGTLIGQPISGTYRVDEDGKISLGPAYGRVAVAGLDTDAAIAAIKAALSKMLRSPEVAVSRLGDDVLNRLEAENHRLQAENSLLKMQISSSREVSSNR